MFRKATDREIELACSSDRVLPPAAYQLEYQEAQVEELIAAMFTLNDECVNSRTFFCPRGTEASKQLVAEIKKAIPEGKYYLRVGTGLGYDLVVNRDFSDYTDRWSTYYARSIQGELESTANDVAFRGIEQVGVIG